MTMKEPLLHRRTRIQLDLYLAHPPHAVLLHGDNGVGKFYVACWLSSQMDAQYSVVEVLDKKSTISIDQIRELYEKTKTGRRQVIIIRDANNLGREAQNAFLKLLEEPPENVSFILTAPSPQSVLATIQSRVTSIQIVVPRREDLSDYYMPEFGGTREDFNKIVSITRGLPGTLSAVISDNEALESTQVEMSEAKKFYGASKYERHTILIAHGYDRDWALQFLQNITTILQALITSNAENKKVLLKLRNQARLIEHTIHNLKNIPGNPKIHLTKLAEQF